jgi:N-acetylglutamate synthase-like GNAT family acetyltransferase
LAEPQKSPAFQVRPPRTDQEWADYFELRWEILRAPWQQSRGSEKDEFEETAWHCAAFHPDGRLIGTGRLHSQNEVQGQIRYMAVTPDCSGMGVGSQILKHLEDTAASKGMTTIVLNAREHAVPFYTRHGYQLGNKEHVLYGNIQHFRMKKVL